MIYPLCYTLTPVALPTILLPHNRTRGHEKTAAANLWKDGWLSSNELPDIGFHICLDTEIANIWLWIPFDNIHDTKNIFYVKINELFETVQTWIAGHI